MNDIEILEVDDEGHSWTAHLPNGHIVENWNCEEEFPEYYEECDRLAKAEYLNELQIQRDRDSDVREYRENLGFR